MSTDVETIANCAGVKATKKALLVRLADDREVWVPQSQIDEDSEVWRPGDSGKLVVAAWFAEKEGLA